MKHMKRPVQEVYKCIFAGFQESENTKCVEWRKPRKRYARVHIENNGNAPVRVNQFMLDFALAYANNIIATREKQQ